MIKQKKSLHRNLPYIILLFAFFISCNDKEKTLSFTELINVEPSVWIESNTIKLTQADSIIINNGEYRINGEKWTRNRDIVPKGSMLTVRVKSSKYPLDVSMCEIIFGKDSTYFKVKTKIYGIPAKNGEVRNINLGKSGPDFATIGGYGPHWLKYNSKKESTGSAVHEGLIPPIQPLIDAQIRDAVICIGGDGRYYMTGSTGDDIWHFNDGVELWVSENLKDWDYIGLVWSFEKDGTWQKPWRFHRIAVRALWAPEIHYIKNNYFITISMPPGDRGLLKSTTGKPEGPYVNALANDEKWDTDIDASLFEDEDGKVYVVYGGGWIAQMKDDMSGMLETPVKPVLIDPDLDTAHHAKSCPVRRGCSDIGHEGAFMFKRNGLYYLTAADIYEGRYSSMVAVSDSIYGPYKWRHEAVPCGGGTSYFRDHEGQWWCTYFGNDRQSAFREMPAMVKVTFSPDGKIFPAKKQPLLDSEKQKEWSKKWNMVWKNKYEG